MDDSAMNNTAVSIPDDQDDPPSDEPQDQHRLLKIETDTKIDKDGGTKIVSAMGDPP